MLFLVGVFILVVALVLIVLDVAEQLAGHGLPKIGWGEPGDAHDDAPEYPWIRRQKKDIRAALKALSESELTIVTRRPYNVRNLRLQESDKLFDNYTKFIAVPPGGYWEAGWISDHYNEECRVDCRRYDSADSLRQAWAKHGREISRKHPGDLHAQAEALYAIEFGCNTFRPALVVGLVKFLNLKHPGEIPVIGPDDRDASAVGPDSRRPRYPARMLDFSAGWGDRLIGAIASDIDYIGVDPNPCTHRGYAKIIKELGDSKRHTVIKAPFEEVPLENLGRADLVLTSPPYFDLEVYSGEAGQSILSFPSEQGWLKGFLEPSLKKCWEALRPGGTLVLVINDKQMPAAGERGFSLAARDYMCSLPGALYRGLLPYAKEFTAAPKHARGGKPGQLVKTYASPQPMFCWYKLPDLGPNGWFTLADFSARPPEWLGLDAQAATWNAEDSRATALTGPEGLATIKQSRPRALTWTGPATTHPHADDPGISRGENIWLGRTRGLVAYTPVKLNPNPPFVVETHENFKVIRDDLLPGGTKQRGHQFLADTPGDGPIVYAGTYGGFCHVAYAVSCWYHRRPFVCFLARNDYPTNIIAKRFGAVIMEIAGAPYPGLKKYAEDWAAANGGTYVLGLYGPEYERYLVEALRKHPIDGHDPKDKIVFWLGATSAMLAKALSVIYPNAFFNLVHLGKHEYNEELPADRMKLWSPAEDFLEPARDPPPYPSVALYEAKIWAIVKANASAEDYVWSTGAE